MRTGVLAAAIALAMPALAHAQDAAKSDKKLNELYRQIESRLKDDADTRKLLVQAQREWVKFRDAECNFQAAGAAGGSVVPTLIAACVDNLTQSRIKDLEGYLHCKEGDLSCPVPAAN